MKGRFSLKRLQDAGWVGPGPRSAQGGRGPGSGWVCPPVPLTKGFDATTEQLLHRAALVQVQGARHGRRHGWARPSCAPGASHGARTGPLSGEREAEPESAPASGAARRAETGRGGHAPCWAGAESFPRGHAPGLNGLARDGATHQLGNELAKKLPAHPGSRGRAEGLPGDGRCPSRPLRRPSLLLTSSPQRHLQHPAAQFCAPSRFPPSTASLPPQGYFGNPEPEGTSEEFLPGMRRGEEPRRPARVAPSRAPRKRRRGCGSPQGPALGEAGWGGEEHSWERGVGVGEEGRRGGAPCGPEASAGSLGLGTARSRATSSVKAPRVPAQPFRRPSSSPVSDAGPPYCTVEVGAHRPSTLGRSGVPRRGR